MPYPTPFHERTAALCESNHWKEWAGFHAVSVYGDCHEREYHAIRQAAGLLDVTPLYKYEVTGKDAGQFLSWVMAREVRRIKSGRVVYVCWCDEDGKLLDDGTVARLSKTHYRVTSSLPSLRWLERHADGFEVEIAESTHDIGALALQGPNARDILAQVCDADLSKLKFFGLAQCSLDGLDVTLTRTGYTGDLGYEIWIDSQHAIKLWDCLISAGKPYNIMPIGLDALDMTRVEAGFVLQGIDYTSARHCLTEWQKSSPYEAGLGWTVKTEREPFIGQQALARDARNGVDWQLVGIDIDWAATEQLYDRYDLPPQLAAQAWRSMIPLYDEDLAIGRATSGTWSPLLKRNIALATVRSNYAKIGTELQIEMTVEYTRERVPARVVEKPFFDPERKTA